MGNDIMIPCSGRRGSGWVQCGQMDENIAIIQLDYLKPNAVIASRVVLDEKQWYQATDKGKPARFTLPSRPAPFIAGPPLNTSRVHHRRYLRGTSANIIRKPYHQFQSRPPSKHCPFPSPR